MIKHLWLCGLLAFGVLAGRDTARADITLVADGATSYEILVSPAAFPITLRAAQDLKLYLKKATGAELPLRRGDAIGSKPVIIVGDCPAARALGVTMDGVPPEGFRIRTVGNNLVIAGRDTDGAANSYHWRQAPQAGTWNGVSAFLEREVGIRWFMPGNDGEYVPHVTTLTVKTLDYSDAPRMIYRPIGYLYSSDTPPQRQHEVIDWLRRNGSGWSIVWQASHTWINYFKWETYYKDHPDWFALVNGRRLASRPLGLQMCTTNPGALDEFARVIIRECRKYPGVMFSLSPNDGDDFCECANCRALDRVKLPNGKPVLTDRIVTYANEVARRVNRVLPDQIFGLYAYSYYADPPTYAKLDPHVYLMAVQNNIGQLYYSAAFCQHHLDKVLLPWSKQVNHFFFYSHPEGFGNMDLPCMQTPVIKALFHNLAEARVQGFSLNYGESFAATGLDRYLYLKMDWNPTANLNAIYRDALEKCYGAKAAPMVDSYFKAVEQRTARFLEQAANKQDIAMGGVQVFPAALDTIYAGLYEEGEPLLKQALSLTDDHGQKARIQLLLDNLEYTRMTVNLYRLSKQVLGTSKPSLDDALRARDLAVARLKDLNEHADTNLHNTRGALYVAQQFSLPFDPLVYERLLTEAKGGKSRAVVTKTATPPKIDGDLSDAAWQSAAELPVDLNKDNAARSALRTVAKVTYDDTSLYIGISCPEPHMSDIKDTVTKRDGEVWNENEVEVFLDPDNARKRYRHLLVNSLGTIADFAFDGEKSVDWDAQADVKVKRGADSWTVEMAIPFRSITGTPPLPGDVWGANFCRVRTVVTPAEYTCWSPTFGGFLQPSRFGYLIFR